MSISKRKETDSTVPTKSTHIKKSKIYHEPMGVESSRPSSAVVEFDVDKGKGIVEAK